MKNIKIIALVVGVAAVLALAVGVLPSLAKNGDPKPKRNVLFDNIPKPLPGNLPSYGFEAYALTELGSQLGLSRAGYTDADVTVVMSSWGCQSGHWYSKDCKSKPGSKFSVPVTLNIYSVGLNNAMGPKLATVTKTFDIPYRPSADKRCTGSEAGKWYSDHDKKCYNGYATKIKFDVDGVQLSEKVVASVVYNTSHYGPTPLGEQTACYNVGGGCGYDSLNIGLSGLATPNSGYYPTPDGGYWNSTFESTGWQGYQPAIRIKTSSEKELKTFTAEETRYYNGPTASYPLYGNGAFSFTWNKETGVVTGGYYDEVVPASTGTTYKNIITGGTVVGNQVNLVFDRTVPNTYHFTFTGTLVDDVLSGMMDGPYLFTATK